MIYLRNNTNLEQWLEDPYTGIKRRVDPAQLTPVSAQIADHAVRLDPEKWEVVRPIAPPAP